MTDNELVKVLRRVHAKYRNRFFGGPELVEIGQLFDVSADRVEQLARENATLRNELCERCGLYKEAHNGACDWCRWHKKGE